MFTVTVSTTPPDDSIIDVTGASQNINTEPQSTELRKHDNAVPFWKHHYVKSYSEIEAATEDQQHFYHIFRDCFLNGDYLDIGDNTNYAFILFFDLLIEYETHKDLAELEKQLDVLGRFYPKTKSYSVDALVKKMLEARDWKGIKRLQANEKKIYSIGSNYHNDEYLLGNKYAEKLELSAEEIAWLNKFWNPDNIFLSIEGCCIETIKLYLAALKELDKQLLDKQTSIEKEAQFFQSETIASVYKAHGGNILQWDFTYFNERAGGEVYKTIFRRAEIVVRELYTYKRKTSGDGDFPSLGNATLAQTFEDRLGQSVNSILQSLKTTVSDPTKTTEIKLNAEDKNRWKIKFEQLTEGFIEKKIEKFVKGVHSLEKLNEKNPKIENIFFEVSKFIAKYDKIQSLKFYIQYLYYDIKSDKIDNKQLTKTIQKNLFKNSEQLNDFNKVVAELIKTKNLETALNDVTKIYEQKRKKIQLNVTAIEEVEKQDEETVELLNEYLQDEYENANTSITAKEINSEEIKIEITAKNDGESQFANRIYLNKIQVETIDLFIVKSFTVPQTEIDEFCKLKGIFKNQLIDSINEVCYETLDDVLIEEDGETYIILENYYKKITAK